MQTLREPRLFNVDEYYRMAAAGILGPSDRVELLEGRIVRMSPIGKLHGSAVDLLNYLLSSELGSKAIVRVQGVVRISEISEPQPDLALLRPRKDFYRNEQPGPHDVLLIIEVADTTLDQDQPKISLYAVAGIREYWIVNLPDYCIEVHRRPSKGAYRERLVFKPGERLAPLAFPRKFIRVGEVFGK